MSWVTIIIPHSNGEAILFRCLSSLQKTRYIRFTTLLVNNASTDRSIPMVLQKFPWVKILHSPVNLGYAGGCNLGIRHVSTPYVGVLNNDTEVTPDWLWPLVQLLEKDKTIAGVQPKLLSLFDPTRFDYAGACGGEIDIFGYPFARGRIFNTVEKDQGQYDSVSDIFWATGAATVFRRSALDEVGFFDESFFAHMEEIDLNWRLHRAGYRICVVPEAIVYHAGGGTLSEIHFRKMVLNHCNSMIMLFKNLSLPSLLWIFSLRLIFEFLAFLGSWAIGMPKRSVAVAVAFWKWMVSFPSIWKERKRAWAIPNRIPEGEVLHRMYRGSIVFKYFLCGKKTYRQLVKNSSMQRVGTSP